jgi:hypothetical protein
VTHGVNCWVWVVTTTAANCGVMLTGTTVNAAPALATPLAVTTTLPVVAPAGTETAIDAALQPVGVAGVPLNVTELVPWVAPKFAPVIVTGAPTAADDGDKLVIVGVGSTVNAAPGLGKSFTATTTLPVVAPAGTVTAIDVTLQLIGVAAMPLNVTELVPWVGPKFVPVTVTAAPTAPEEGDRLVMPGGGGGELEVPPPLLPHPDRPSVAPKAIPRQRTPALLATLVHLTRRQFIESGRQHNTAYGAAVWWIRAAKGNSRHLTLIALM